MDGSRFDSWTKALIAGAGSRRLALQTLTGLALGGLLGVPAASAREEKIKPGERCEKNGQSLGECVKGAFCNKKGYCKCGKGLCHYEARCAGKCGGTQCCDAGLYCCKNIHGQEDCYFPDLQCGKCKVPCTKNLCCALNQHCTRCRDYSYRCTKPGETC
jgi:hypothetical protein